MVKSIRKIFEVYYRHQSLIYKGLLYLSSLLLILYLLPKEGKFKYEFQLGKPWLHETLYAPYDFAIYKTAEEVESEKEEIRASSPVYYDVNQEVIDLARKGLITRLDEYFPDSLKVNKPSIQKQLMDIFDGFYQYGIIENSSDLNTKNPLFLITGNMIQEVTPQDLILMASLEQQLQNRIKNTLLENYYINSYNLFFDILKPNVFRNEKYTQNELNRQLDNVTNTRGSVERGVRIISKGEVVEGEKYTILLSLEKEFESELWTKSNYSWIVLGYSLLVALALLMLLFFLNKYRPHIFNNNRKVTFIYFNILLMVFLTTLVVKYDAGYVYVVPLCILPIILKAFFDARLGLFAHVLTVLILGFIVPNSFEYLFLQVIAGMATILTVSELYRRANLFISVGQITLIYIISYFAFILIQEGRIDDIEWANFGLFILNGLATLFAQPLIYIYEKLFGLVSDVSLLELSDTNSKLLRELSEKAPGTFNHSLQVANLAEASANEIGANAMLVRVGALYHDIGKIHSPLYFTENQRTSMNPHDELSPKESAQIIINHVSEGIRLAKKYNIPDRIIDFIRTHHGTTSVYYFLKKQEILKEPFDKTDFYYPGPKPFSKETAILMIADAVEAASKSLREPTGSKIDSFVESIVDRQMEEEQFLNADITLKEIETVKKVLKRRLSNIYHLRIEYPS